MIKAPKNLRSFEALVQVVEALRHPEHGCPWDLEQTHKTLTSHAIEEAFELVEAIEFGNREHIIEELGDVLLQVVLHSVIARQSGNFDLLDVIENLNKKLVYRHSHVFSDVKADNAQEAIDNWEKMKAEEKAKKPQKDGFDIPVELPALQRSQKIGAKTKKLRFDWDKIEAVRAKVEEELQEFDAAYKSGNLDKIEDEMGDVLFSTTQLARHAGVDAEKALRRSNKKFETRFFEMKKLAQKKGLVFDTLPQEDLEKLYQEVKISLKS